MARSSGCDTEPALKKGDGILRNSESILLPFKSQRQGLLKHRTHEGGSLVCSYFNFKALLD